MSLHARASLALGKVAVALAFAGIAVAAHADTVRVTVAHYSDATGPYFEKMARDFEKANPGTTIKIEVVNWDDLLQKLQTDISRRHQSRHLDHRHALAARFRQGRHRRAARRLHDPELQGPLHRPFLKPATINGKIYGLPIAASARALFYNKDLLTKAGFPNGPTTWDDVVAASKKLKAAGGCRLRPARQGDRNRRLLVLRAVDLWRRRGRHERQGGVRQPGRHQGADALQDR